MLAEECVLLGPLELDPDAAPVEVPLLDDDDPAAVVVVDVVETLAFLVEALAPVPAFVGFLLTCAVVLVPAESEVTPPEGVEVVPSEAAVCAFGLVEPHAATPSDSPLAIATAATTCRNLSESGSATIVIVLPRRRRGY